MNSQWLNAQFESNPNLSKSALAKQLGLESPAVSKILNGTRQIKADEYHAMRLFFGLPVDGNTSVYQKTQAQNNDSPHQKTYNAAEKDHPFQDGQSVYHYTDDTAENLPKYIKIFENKEIIMSPYFNQGEHVLVDIADTEIKTSGTYMITDGHDYLIRDCSAIPLSKPKQIQISARNKDFENQIIDLDHITIIGRVIAKLVMF